MFPRGNLACEELCNIWSVITALIQMTEIRANFGLSKVWHTWTAAERRDNQTGSSAINICVKREVGHFDQIPPNQRSRCLQFSRLILLLWFGSRNLSPFATRRRTCRWLCAAHTYSCRLWGALGTVVWD